jgi:hypothetical protein
MAIKSFTPMARLPDSLTHMRHRGGPDDESLKMLMLHAGGLKGGELMLNVFLRCPLSSMVPFSLLISISPSGKLCTLVSSRKASLIPLAT